MKIYLITNRINGKRYVGITRRSVDDRWLEHLEAARGARSNRALTCAIRKHGATAFSIEEIGEADDWDSLCAAEVELIDSLKTKAPQGYNMTDGGDGSIGLCDEAMARMRAKCQALRHTDETKIKISEAGKGRKHSADAKKKISEAHTGKTLSEEHRAKLASAKLGKPMPTRSDEHKRKISEGLKEAHRRRREAENK